MTCSSDTKALIVGPSWVGDMVMAHTLVQSLVAHTPGIELHMLAPPASAPLAWRMKEVKAVHTLEVGHGEFGWAARREWGREFAKMHFDCAYILPNSWKSALIPFFAGVKRRVGWHGEARFMLLNDRRRLDPARYPLMVERFMALADDDGQLPTQPYPTPQLEADAANVARCCSALELKVDNVTALCPGAEFGAAKKWPAKHYAEVARAILARGGQVWLMGSPSDGADCAEISELAPGCVNLAGRTSLLDAVDLLSVCRQVVCNDSGLMHVACALGCRTVGVYGSTSPKFTPPLGDSATIVERTLDCRPCFQRVCPLGHLECLNRLGPDQVLMHLEL